MKTRLTLIFAALVVLLGAMGWLLQDRRMNPALPVMAAEHDLNMSVAPAAAPTTPPTTPSTAAPAIAAAVPVATAPVALIVTPVFQSTTTPMVHVEVSGEMKYVARAGDTVSELAIALLGSDSKAHRDWVIAANSSLQTNPDRVLEGQTYSIDLSAVPVSDNAAAAQMPNVAAIVPVTSASPKEISPSVNPASDDKAVDAASGPKLKYTAQPGDSVAVLAGNLLGGDTRANRETIIAGNASLQQDPNHLVAGKTYTIAVPNGLAADPSAPQAKVPATQPDADEVAQLSVGRTLRYTAQPGDSVSKLAVVLLGSDTPANRDLVTKSNPSLKKDPDHLVAGQTYWIAAPTADAMP